MNPPLSCAEARALFSSLLAGSIDPGEQEALEEHLRRCRDCEDATREMVAQDLDLREFGVRSSAGAASRLSESLRSEDESRSQKVRTRRLSRSKESAPPASTGKIALIAAAVIAAMLVTVWVSSSGVERVVQGIPVDDVFLQPRQGKITGKDWQLFAAPEGEVLEAPSVLSRNFPDRKTSGYLRKLPSYVTFTFLAEANKDYHLWVRGTCTSTENRQNRDAVAVEFGEGRFAVPCPIFGASGENAFMFDAFYKKPGYWWVGGDADRDDVKGNAVVRFPRSGLQTLRLYAIETPMRIDAIWLSTTQKTRPSDAQRAPETLMK